MAVAKILALDKISRLFQIFKQHGGILGTLGKIYRTDEAKLGTLVGEDKYGNKYYENKMYFYGRNRWVDYAPQVGMNYDGSQVCAEWFGWLHYKTDMLPHQDIGRPKYTWMADHIQNMSGTDEAYTPYSTTRPKIQAWAPPKH